MSNSDTRTLFKQKWQYALRGAGYQQQEIAHLLNVDATTLSKWVNGHVPWPHDALTHACERLELPAPAQQELFALAGLAQPAPVAAVEPVEPLVAPEPRAPFIGLLPFRFTDADLFFGRDGAIDSLLTKLTAEHTRLLVVNGLSGAGKTSLLRAGLVPRLRGLGYTVAYSQILDSPKSDVRCGIYAAFDTPSIDAEAGLVEAIDAVARVPSCPLVLIIDQLERCLSSTQRDAEHTNFWKDLARLIGGESRHDVQIILAVRSDWLHAFQSVPLNVPVFDFLFLMQPFTRDEAKKALTGPLGFFGIAHEPGLIDAVVNDLAFQKERVNPPELQIVGLALYRHAWQAAGQEPKRLTLANYKSLQGARTIIRNHLVNTVNNLGPSAQECWQILLRLVGPENQRISKHAEELRGNLAPHDFENIVANLERAHLISRQISARDNRPVYTLPHDYLVEEINQYVEQDLKLQAWRTAGHYLDQGLADWRSAQEAGAADLLLERARYRTIWAQRAGFGPLAGDACLFLLKSALYQGEESFAYWLEQMPAEFLPTANDAVRDAALFGAEEQAEAGQQAVIIAAHSGLLADANLQALKAVFWQVFTSVRNSAGADGAGRGAAASVVAKQLRAETPTPAEGAAPELSQKFAASMGTWRTRDAAASILWALRAHLTPHEQWTVAPVVARRWLHHYRALLWSAAGSAAVVSLLVLAAWWFNRSMRGDWLVANSLVAGPVSAVALSSVEPGSLYAVIQRGPGIGDGAALVKREHPSHEWRVLSRSLTYLPVSDLLVTPLGDGVRIYLSIHGKGIERSDDGGTTWQLTNAGLFSYDIRGLAVHPQRPELLYAIAADAKGVFRSADGGDSWQDVSGQTLFGASALSIAHTQYVGERWLVGTADGRIVAQRSDELDWRPLSIFPGAGAIVTLAAEARNGREVYAGTSTGLVSVSLDGGENWVVLDRIPGVFGVNSLAVVPGHGEQVLMSAFGVGGHIVWQSDDYGQSWQQIADHRFTREPVRLISHPLDAGKLYAAGFPGLFESTDRGHSWAYQVHLPAPIVSADRMAISPLADGPIYVATGGAVFTSHTPQHGGWIRGHDLPAIVVRDVVVDPGDAARAYAGVYLPNLWSIFMTIDAGATWTPTAVPAAIPQKFLNDTMSLSAVRAGEQIWLYAGTTGCGVLFSPNAGQSWDTFGREDCVLPAEAPKSVIGLAADPFNPERIYAAADSTRVHVSEDQGRTWSVAQLEITTPIFAIAADPQIRDRVYLIAGSDGFWRSDDGGRQWRYHSAGLRDKSIVAMVVVPGRAETLFIAAANGEVWKTTNGGQRWRPVTENLAVAHAGSLAFDARTRQLVLAAGADGLYWYREGTLFPRTR